MSFYIERNVDIENYHQAEAVILPPGDKDFAALSDAQPSSSDKSALRKMQHMLSPAPRGPHLINIQIFEETLRYIEEHELLTPEFSLCDCECPQVATVRTQTNMMVLNETTFSVARTLLQEGLNPLILDMANKSSPGGSVLAGSGAQEETLCRQSNLYVALQRAKERGYYPIPEHGGILVKNVTFFRDDTYAFLASPYEVDVFVVAAYDCNPHHRANFELHLYGYDRPESDADYENGSKAKIRAMFYAAKKNGNDSLVLGALGCGTFQNDPLKIAQWFKEVLEEEDFQNVFKVVAFAIKDDGGEKIGAFHTIFVP